MLKSSPLFVLFALSIATNLNAGQVAGTTAGGSASASEVSKLAREAQAALNSGDDQTALRDYERLVKTEPGNATFNLNLGIALYTSERPSEAVKFLQQALRIKPSLTQASVYLGASLAESGRCQEAIPLVLKEAPHITNPQLKRTAEGDGLKCAMALDQEERALDFIHLMQKDFPNDPEVLYLTVHVYSDLSTRASQRLLMTAPSSYQVHLLDAEILEMQEKWDDAEAEYRRVLEIDPHAPGIHFRIAGLLLSRPKTATSMADATKEYEEELKIDPNNAAAEYVLGELAKRAQNLPAAIEHFSRASKLDPTFQDAFIGLGKSLVSSGRPADAVAPLEAAVRLEPRNPVAHYQLAFAYRRVGRAEDSDKELAAYKKTTTEARQNLQDLRSAVTGREVPAQTAEPPD